MHGKLKKDMEKDVLREKKENMKRIEKNSNHLEIIKEKRIACMGS